MTLTKRRIILTEVPQPIYARVYLIAMRFQEELNRFVATSSKAQHNSIDRMGQLGLSDHFWKGNTPEIIG